MADIMTVWAWSLADFDRVDTLDDLIDWHTRAIKAWNKTNGATPRE